jgi:hypothetical protein
MADFVGAVAALQQLATDAVRVEVDGTRVRVCVRYGDPSFGDAGVGGGWSEFTVVADLDPADGEYRLHTEERGASANVSGGGLSGSYEISYNRGTSRSFRRASGTSMGGGTYRVDFDSAPWQHTVVERLEAHGWTRRRGFLSRLFS